MVIKTLGDVAVESSVKINEGGSLVDFTVIQQTDPGGQYVGFADGTVVLRKDIHSNRQLDPYGNSYNYCSLNAWLNNESSGYLSLLSPDIRNSIKTVSAPDLYERKIFILSRDEYYGTGSVFSYFVGADDNKRIASLNGYPRSHWTRTQGPNDDEHYYDVSQTGSTGSRPPVTASEGVRPAFVLPKSLFVLDDGTVTSNQPPTAPGSIEVSGVVRGGSATITLTAATDPDGTVESYIYERQVDGGAWQQVAQANILTQIDPVSEDWGSVAYRACAVDDLGVSGPYITSETYTVNSGWVTIGGPAEDMGRQPRRFDFAFSVSVSGVASVDAITVSVARDGTQIYSGTPSAGEQISVPVDARLLGAGEHVIEVQASKDDYLPASRRYSFTVPAATIPDGGYGAISQASDGKTMFYTTLAQRCIGTDGVDIQAQVDALAARVKTLEG